MAKCITVTGADPADYRRSVTEETRVLVFPDGIDRHFTLTKRQWEIFDLWESIPNHPGRIIPSIFKTAQEIAIEFERPPSCFESDLRYAMSARLKAAAAFCSVQGGLNEKNDNDPRS